MAKAELIKARELIANGWTQGSLASAYTGKLCYCLDGAIGAAHLGSNNFGYDTIRDTPAVVEDLEYMSKFTLPIIQNWGYLGEMSLEDVKRYGLSMEANYIFNDNSNTSQADVLSIMDKAIENYPDETGA